MEAHDRHVGVDATCWRLNRGFGRHARCLLSALVQVDRRNRYTFFVDSPEVAGEIPDGPAVRVVPVGSPTIIAASARGHRSLTDLARMSRALSSDDLDVLFFPSLYSYVPTFGRARRYVVLHDATAEMFPAMTLGGWRNRLLWRAKTSLGRWQADVLVTVSDYSRRAIAERLHLAPQSLHVVGEASAPVFRVLQNPAPTPRLMNAGFDGIGRSLVYLGGFSPHKNLGALVRSFGRLSRLPEFQDVRLFMVGDHEHEVFVSGYRELVRQIDTLGLAGRVTFTGFLPDEDLVVLLNLATALALPSLTEGLGLPALEAAACGCAVVATTESPLPELLGEGGRFVDPHDEPALDRALASVLGSPDERRRMRQAALEATGRLSWQSAASRLVALFENGAAR
jgi:glycosyltransferase involved in cell wall biosynthesis